MSTTDSALLASSSTASASPDSSFQADSTGRSPHPSSTTEIITIRPMTEDDLPVLSQIMGESFNDLDDWNVGRLTQQMHDCGEIGLVAVVDKEVVGLLFYAPWGDAAYLSEMATRPQWRSRGVGSELIREFFARRIEQTGAWLHVYCTNERAQVFYQRHGFQIFGRQANGYGPGDGNDAFIMIQGERFCEEVHSRPEVYKELWKCS